jgi:hypothetical protein
MHRTPELKMLFRGPFVTYVDYIAFSERLREAHFTEDKGEKPLTCRWHNGALTVDVLALNEEVLGFTNIWYESALRHAFIVILPSGQSIRVITAPFFLGTKIEAFRGRGKMDFQASHDLEDFVAVIEGRDTFLDSSWITSGSPSSKNGLPNLYGKDKKLPISSTQSLGMLSRDRRSSTLGSPGRGIDVGHSWNRTIRRCNQS